MRLVDELLGLWPPMTDVFAFDDGRASSFLKRIIAIAFGTGLVLALFSSGSIALYRTLGLGSARFAFASSMILVGISTLALGIGLRSRSTTFVLNEQRAQVRPAVILLPQLVGGVLGIAVVHLLLRGISSAPWLCETPRQFVNDAAAMLGIVSVLHACGTRSLKFVPLAIGLATLTMYSATGMLWHVDQPPRAFEVGVQELVLTQVTSVSVALIFFRLAMTTPRTRV